MRKIAAAVVLIGFVSAGGLYTQIATSQSPSPVQQDMRICRLSWSFPGIGDKRYNGEGLSDSEASRNAVEACVRENFPDDWKQICRTTPKTRDCRSKFPPPNSGGNAPPPPQLLACQPGPAPADALSTPEHRAEKKDRPHSTVNAEFSIPANAKRVTTWCKVRDDHGEVWCRFTKGDKKSCDYWFIPVDTKAVWRKDHWDIWTLFYNEKHDRIRFLKVFYKVE